MPNTNAPETQVAALPRRQMLAVTLIRSGLLGIWFLATLAIARRLGPLRLATYALCQNAIRLFTDCFADPLDMAVMRDAPLHLRGDRNRAMDVIRSAFWLRVALGITAIAVSAAVPWTISKIVFGPTSHYHRLVLLMAAGILGDLLLRSALGYFQVSQQFLPFLAIDAVWQIGRTAAVAVLMRFYMLGPSTAIMVYVAAPYVAYAVAVILLPADVLRPRLPHRRNLIAILHYSKWLVAALMMGAIYERLDIFLLNWFRGTAEVGIYAGALTLAMIPDSFNSIVQTVVAPKIAPSHAAGEFRHLQRQYLALAIPAGAIAAAVAWLAGGPFVRIILGHKFHDSVVPFQILILGTLFNLVFTPLPTALLNFVRPRQTTVLTAVGLGMVTVGGVLLIPVWGATGAAMTIVSVRVGVGVATIALVRRFT